MNRETFERCGFSNVFEVKELPPENSARLAPKFSKIQSGLSGQNQEAVERVKRVFDELEPELASEIMARTSFGVSSMARLTGGISDPQKRRNLARAIFFVSDIISYFDGGLKEKPSTQEFERLWSVKASTLDVMLQERLSAFNSACDKLNRTVNAKFEEKPKKMPIRPVGAALKSFLEGALDLDNRVGLQRERMLRHVHEDPTKEYTEVRQARTNDLRALYSNMRQNLGVEWTAAIAKQLNSSQALLVAAEAAHTEFSNFFTEQAEQKQAQVLLAVSCCSALGDHAPWPVNEIGKLGAKVLDQVKVDSHLETGRRREAPVYETETTLQSVAGHARTAQRKINDLRTIGTRARDLPPLFTFREVLADACTKAQQEAERKVHATLIQEFGDAAAFQEDKVSEDALELLRGTANLSEGIIRQRFRDHAAGKEKKLKQAISEVRGLETVNPNVLQRFLELQLYATFMDSLAPADCDINKVKVPEALIARLNERFHGPLVIRKSEGGKSQANLIFAGGHLPWAAGHPRHVGGLVLFFRWYAAHVNAFDLAVGRMSVSDLEEQIKSVIMKIGALIEVNRVSRRFGRATADWDAVEGEM